MALLNSRTARGALIHVLPPPDGTVDKFDRWALLGLVYATVPEIPIDGSTGFNVIGRFSIAGFSADSEKVSFKLEELKTRVDIKLPRMVVTRAIYPNAPEISIGARLPLVYGKVYDVTCICINEAANTFAVAGHEITRLGTVRIDGTPAPASSIDLATGTFTLATYTSGTVTATVEGKPHATLNGPMVNAADVVEDLLTVEAGEPSARIDAASFAAARSYYRLGTSVAGEEVARGNLAFAVTDSTDAAELLERIQVATFGLLYIGHEGTYKLKPWRPVHPDGLLSLTDADILELEPEASKGDLVTRIVATYRERPGNATLAQVHIREDEAARLSYGLPSHRELETALPFNDLRDVEVWTSRVLAMRRRDARYWSVKTSQVALLLEPGDCVAISATCYDVQGRTLARLEGIYDVIQVEKDPTGGDVSLLVSDVRGLGTYNAFLMAGDETLPAKLGGDPAAPYAPAWSAEAKKYALRRGAYVSDQFRMIDGDDEETFNASSVS